MLMFLSLCFANEAPRPPGNNATPQISQEAMKDLLLQTRDYISQQFPEFAQQPQHRMHDPETLSDMAAAMMQYGNSPGMITSILMGMTAPHQTSTQISEEDRLSLLNMPISKWFTGWESACKRINENGLFSAFQGLGVVLGIIDDYTQRQEQFHAFINSLNLSSFSEANPLRIATINSCHSCYAVMLVYIQKIILLGHTPHVLVLGPGNGIESILPNLICPKKTVVTLIDKEQNSVRQALIQRAIDAGVVDSKNQPIYLQKDLITCEFPKDQNVITASCVLPLVPLENQEKVLKKIMNHLKSGSIFVFIGYKKGQIGDPKNDQTVSNVENFFKTKAIDMGEFHCQLIVQKPA